MLDKLWAVTEKGENYNNSILYLHISEYALKTEISFTESIRNSHSVNVRLTLYHDLLDVSVTESACPFMSMIALPL